MKTKDMLKAWANLVNTKEGKIFMGCYPTEIVENNTYSEVKDDKNQVEVIYKGIDIK